MPLQATSGAASYDAFGGGVPVVPNYIEDVFSSYLWTGNDATQTITNGIDLAGKGGLVWMKGRSEVGNHYLATTNGGNTSYLNSDTTNAYQTSVTRITSFNANGFSLGGSGSVNGAGATYVSWTFRKQPKFFDVVTYTGDGTGPRAISHNLGSTPGCIFVKRTSGSQNWEVYHRSLTSNQYYLELNQTSAQDDSGQSWDVTSTTFNANSNLSLNTNGATYVAYLFAHDAGGFGLTGTDNVISCGSFTTDGSGNATVSLGYEPQWLLTKSSSGTSSWMLLDNMRGWVSGAGDYPLYANLTNAEGASTSQTAGDPTATGFTTVLNPSATYIYIAIRRGPMKVPTSGTSVFAPSTAVEPQSSALFTAGFSDMTLHKPRLSEGNAPWITDRLRGNGVVLQTPYTSAEATYSTYFKYDSNAGAYIPASGYYNNSGGGTIPYALYAFKRAPSFFDEVCYTGTGADPQTVPHNLGKAPELMIFKARAVGAGWRIWGGNMAITEYLALNEDSAVVTGPAFFGGTLPTATSFYVGSGLSVSARTHVAYLFATAAGVSKVFSYTGNGSSQTINCGFTGGARFVLIKRTDDVGDWYVWDSARGIVSGNDPHLSLNTTAAEVTSDDTIDTDSTGFVVNQVSATNVNVSSATYIGLAIA